VVRRVYPETTWPGSTQFTARAHDRIFRVVRTVADLAGSERVETGHVAEAVGYRTLDRKLWMW
jgi:magnesium chelatase family protein